LHNNFPHTQTKKKITRNKKRFYTSVEKPKLAIFTGKRNPLREMPTIINNAGETFYSNEDFKGLRKQTSILRI
jgi:hypothetical protein